MSGNDDMQVSYNLPPATVAAAVLGLDAARPDPDVTPAKLQRLLYLAQGHYLAATGQRLFTAPLLAATQGPVVPPVRREYAAYEGSIITVARRQPRPPGVPTDVREFLTRVWDQYADHSGAALTRLTRTRGPWVAAHAHGEGSVIQERAMIDYFRHQVPAPERVLHPGIVVLTQQDLDNLDQDEGDIIDRALTALQKGEPHD